MSNTQQKKADDSFDETVDKLSSEGSEEAYVELFKKYRPTRWDDLVGQQTVAQQLKKAVADGRVPSPMFFSGPPGTGKTTAALILAKAVNCENPPGDGNPCNECETCVAIDNHHQPGVSLKSMANEGSIDSVRSLVEQSTYNHSLKRNVIILDEVHNLSTQAQDVLLQPFEMKSNKALYIMCTTEPSKMTKPLLSRSQQRKFVAVQPQDIAELLQSICEKEGMEPLSENELEAAVAGGAGSVRNSISAMETILNGGSSEKKFALSLLVRIAQENFPRCVYIINEAYNSGVDGADMLDDIIKYLSDMLLFNYNMEEYMSAPIELPHDAIAQTIEHFGGARGLDDLIGIVGKQYSGLTMNSSSRTAIILATHKAVRYVSSISD